MSVVQERNSELVDLLLADFLPRPKAGQIYRLVIPDTLTPGFVIVNEDGTIEIAIDTLNHRVGIGTGSPNVTLDVRGAADIIGNLQVSGSGLFTAVITARGGLQNDAGNLTLSDDVDVTGDLTVDGEIIHDWTPSSDPETKILSYWNHPAGNEWVIEGITVLSTLATGTNDISLGIDLDDWGGAVRTGVTVYGFLAGDDTSSNYRGAQFTARARWTTAIGNQGGTVVADESGGIITGFTMDIDSTTHVVELRVTTNTVTLSEIVIRWTMIGTNL